MHNIKKINPLIIYQEEKTTELIKKINKSKIKIIFVLDRNKRLTGSITSGDLRRFLTKKIFLPLSTKLTEKGRLGRYS